jgi:hypothetical protein
MDDRARAICHEAGHTVVGLHFGFHIDKVEISEGRSNVKCADLESSERSANERFVFLAGGIAGEKFFDPSSDYCREAASCDQSMITKLGGRSIEEYLPEALDTVRSHEKVLGVLRTQMTKRWVAEEFQLRFVAAAGGKRSRSFPLLSRQEIEKIWVHQ